MLHRREFVGLVADALVVSDCHPATFPDLFQPDFIRAVVDEMVLVPLDREARIAQDLRKPLGQVPVGEKDRSGRHAARS